MQNIKRTGKLRSDGGFFICDSHFDESCFEVDLKVIILVLLCLFKFRRCIFEELNIPNYFVIALDKNILIQKYYVTCVFGEISVPKLKCSVKNCARNRCSANLPHKYVVHILEKNTSLQITIYVLLH